MGKNKKRESMRNKKKKRRLKRIEDNNRKTIGQGWDTQKTTKLKKKEPERIKSFWERIFDRFRG